MQRTPLRGQICTDAEDIKRLRYYKLLEIQVVEFGLRFKRKVEYERKQENIPSYSNCVGNRFCKPALKVPVHCSKSRRITQLSALSRNPSMIADEQL
jgi:hypothetical protein